MIVAWILAAILTATDVIPEGSPGRTDYRSAVLQDSPWFYIPHPCKIYHHRTKRKINSNHYQGQNLADVKIFFIKIRILLIIVYKKEILIGKMH